jgi:hypothetical protein
MTVATASASKAISVTRVRTATVATR